MEADRLWTLFEFDLEIFDTKPAWLRQPRRLHSASLCFFDQSALLFSLARSHYSLGSVAFFHAIPGVERALQIHYGTKEIKLRELLNQAVNDGVICDDLFVGRRPLSKDFERSMRRMFGPLPAEYPALLAKLIPELRNMYFHGTYLLAPDYLYLTLEMRIIADALDTQKTLKELRG